MPMLESLPCYCGYLFLIRIFLRNKQGSKTCLDLFRRCVFALGVAGLVIKFLRGGNQSCVSNQEAGRGAGHIMIPGRCFVDWTVLPRSRTMNTVSMGQGLDFSAVCCL